MLSAVTHAILTLCGYDRNVVARLPFKDVLFLTFCSALCLVSAGMYAVSTGYIVYIAVYADSARWFTAALIGAGVLVFAVTMQRLYVTTGGYAHHWDQKRLAEWRPDQLRIICVFVIASLLSLPWVLMRNHDHLNIGLEEIRETKVAFYRDQLHTTRQATQQAIARSRDLVADSEQRVSALVSGHMPNPSSTDISPARRKALLIGGENYTFGAAASGVGKDIRSLKRAFMAAGFATTISFDESGDELRLSIDAYLKSLVAGDIGVVYYAGRTLQHAKRNYLLPVDYHPERNTNGYPVSQLIDDLVKTTSALNVLILDNSYLLERKTTPALAPVRSAPRTIIVHSTIPAAFGRNRSANGSVLAAALTDQLGRTFNMRQVVERAAANVQKNPSAPTLALIYGSTFRQSEDSLTERATPVAIGDETVLSENAGCPTEGTAALQRCLRARLSVLDAKLSAMKLGQVEDEIAVKQYKKSVERSSMLRERWKLLWEDPMVVIQIIFVIFVMMLGDLLRDVRVGPLRHYEESRTRSARDAIEVAYSQVRQSVDSMLARYPGNSLPGLRWHERPKYFGRPSAALLSLGGIVAAQSGSEAELLQVLGFSNPSFPAPEVGLMETSVPIVAST